MMAPSSMPVQVHQQPGESYSQSNQSDRRDSRPMLEILPESFVGYWRGIAAAPESASFPLSRGQSATLEAWQEGEWCRRFAFDAQMADDGSAGRTTHVRGSREVGSGANSARTKARPKSYKK